MKRQRVSPEVEFTLEEHLQSDPELREQWERMAPVHELIELRIRRGLTQAQLAERVGTTQSAISRLEAGQVEPTLDTLRRVAAALDSRVEIHIRPREAAA